MDDPMRLRPGQAPARSAPTPPMRQWIDAGIERLQQSQEPAPVEPTNTERLRAARARREQEATAANLDAAQQQSREPGAAGAFFRSRDENRQAIQLTKQQEAKAAIAIMKQQEGRPLSADEQEAYSLWQQSGAMRDAAAQRYAVRKTNPLYHETKQHIGQTREAQSQILGGRVAEYDARLEHERQVEAFRARVALEDDMVAAGIQAKEQKRQELMDEAVQATRESQRLVQEAAEKFARTPGVDANRLWASKTAGQKFGAAILSIVGARAGAVLPGSFQAIQQSIKEDIDAQKTNLDLARTQYAALGDAFQAQRGAYADIRAAVDDERTADMLYERARLEQAEREFGWWMQKGAVSQLSAGQQAFLGEIQQAKANLDLQLAQRTKANPRQFVKVVKNPAAKALNARAGKLEDFALETLKGEREHRGKMDVERLKAEGDSGPTEQEKSRSWEQRKWIATETRPFRTELELIRKFQDKYPNSIPGVGGLGETGGAVAGAAAGFQTGFLPGAIIGGIVGANSGNLTAEQRDARAALERIVMVRLRRESGAAIGDDELYRDAKRIVDGWTDEDVARELSARATEASAGIDLIERAPDETEVERYRRAPVQERRAITEQAGVADPTQIDDDAIPYATPR